MKKKNKNRPGLRHQLVCRETNNYQPFSLNHLPLEKEIKGKDLDSRSFLGTLDQKKNLRLFLQKKEQKTEKNLCFDFSNKTKFLLSKFISLLSFILSPIYFLSFLIWDKVHIVR